ncbi:response regulator [Labilibaculum sp. A4]|uniref:Response regulator n=1 Tax=Labilibaculum euxinus TaxID=2686357 RepID=A0A425Y5F1_9BACT|nr:MULTISPECIES: response regulator transcription factor [Labilibaculum]MBN2597585.1 response regulator transcription factor [Marinifilaceae bacterium]MDQ1772323.1 response regulator transcription factor [Labilibaculum euxinus]MUP37135.1 response regulator [Labilibaculum euxinus]MVB06340.1 response regulator [Labilibaculum euxinus]MWN77979.1 response regulator [Labilibaculum euxinus]
MARSTILIADNSCMIRKGLRSILQNLENSEVIQLIDNKEDVCGIVHKRKPDILIINPDMLPGDCLDAKREFFNENKLSLILLSNKKNLKNDLKADGYINYMDGQNTILDMMQEILNKNNKSSFPDKNSETISSREKNILKHIALGLTNKEIADQLFISIHTVVTHRKNITQKLGIKSVSGLTVYAILHNLISMDEVK